MQTILNTIKTNWNFFRVARLLLGIGALVQAIMLREWPLALAGLFIAGMALANTGCGIGGCTPGTLTNPNEMKNINKITYETVDTEK